MQNLYKRHKTYYIRLSINQDLQIYFNNKNEYIRSLQTHNINNAKIILKYLLAKFNYIKRSIKMMNAQEIKKYIEEFKKINYDDIINRNSHLSIEQIDAQIKELNNNVDIYDEIIEKELYDLIQIIDIDDKYELEFGLDVDISEKFKNYIIQIKINALNEVKKNILNKVDILRADHIVNDDFITIEEAIKEFDNTRDSISIKQKKTSAKDVNNFLEFCNISNIKYIQKLKHKDLISYRVHLKKIKNKLKIGPLNNALKNVITFVNYCSDKANYIPKITKDVLFDLTIKDKLAKKRSPYSNNNYKKILDNIDFIRLTPKRKKPNKYNKEYELIIKIAAHTGARENEICQLTKNDIKISEDSIYYFNFTIDIEEDINSEKTLKTISSIRKVPIHFDILDEVLLYIDRTKRKNLFTIKASKFSEDYSSFKTSLGFDRSYVFHSFRNTLQNKLKQLKVQYEIIKEIAGHGPEDDNKITNDYTDKYDLHILQEALEKVSYKN